MYSGVLLKAFIALYCLITVITVQGKNHYTDFVVFLFVLHFQPAFPFHCNLIHKIINHFLHIKENMNIGQ